MASHTIRLHRVLRAPPERTYRAFLDADAMVKWPLNLLALLVEAEIPAG